MSCQLLFSLHKSVEHFKLTKIDQTRRRFGGRQPLCGIGVTSRITTMCKPAAASARTADSRPEPGPCTRTSMLFMPYVSRATVAVESEACCAAYGVPLREPLKPIAPAEDQQSVRPSESVIVICVLLNSFLRFAAAAPPAAGFAGACVASCAPFCSFATFCSVFLTARQIKKSKTD